MGVGAVMGASVGIFVGLSVSNVSVGSSVTVWAEVGLTVVSFSGEMVGTSVTVAGVGLTQ